MYKFLKATKDASIYRGNPNMNTGLDPILEVTKTFPGDDAAAEITRALLHFDVSPLSGSNYSVAELLLTETRSTEIQLDYDIFAFPVAERWTMGTGRSDDTIVNDNGVTWNFRNGETALEWSSPTGSNISGSGEGGIWRADIVSSQTYDYETSDVAMDVTPIVDAHVSESIENNGIILKFSSGSENDSVDYGQLKFFSKETHTIYEPLIRVGILDSEFDQDKFESGSFQDIRTVKVHANVKTEYFVDESYRIDLVCRELYPVKLFDSFKYDATGCFLPEDSFYRVIDIASGRELIPYSEYSKIQLDEYGNFINIDFTNWEIDRDYAIELKIMQNKSPIFFNNKFIFTLIG